MLHSGTFCPGDELQLYVLFLHSDMQTVTIPICLYNQGYCCLLWLVFFNRNILQYAYIGLIKKELDQVATEWNDHRIRKQCGNEVPSGLPAILFDFPELQAIIKTTEYFAFCVEILCNCTYIYVQVILHNTNCKLRSGGVNCQHAVNTEELQWAYSVSKASPNTKVDSIQRYLDYVMLSENLQLPKNPPEALQLYNRLYSIAIGI